MRVGPVGAISSSPSSPRNTSALAPRPASTPARSGAIRASATPIAADRGWAGLVSGPRKLKAVPMPSSVRAAAVCRNDGWNTCAKQKVMPTSVASSATRAGGWSSRMPSASSTSAEPEDDDAARLPCLTTVMPGAGDDEGGHRRDVHGVRAVAAGADDVERPAGDLDADGVREHRVGQRR